MSAQIQPQIQAVVIHPLVPLDRAVNLLKASHSELEQSLIDGAIKGEKRSDGDPQDQKNSWFIYASEFNRLLNDQLAGYEKRISTAGLEQLFERELSPVEILEAKIEELSAEIECLRGQIGQHQPTKASALQILWQRAARLCPGR